MTGIPRRPIPLTEVTVNFPKQRLKGMILGLAVLRVHTSNSSQNPCLGFSELSATLLSSRTRFSMLAAFILVALKGCHCPVETGKLN